MNPDAIEQSMDQDTDLTAHQRRCMQDLLSKLKEITLKIEELDDQEDRIQGDAPGDRDQLRAINIQRIVFVNQQKDLEDKLSDIVNTCPPPEPTPPPPSSPNTTPEPEAMLHVSLSEPEEICLDDDLDIIQVAPAPVERPEERPRERAEPNTSRTPPHTPAPSPLTPPVTTPAPTRRSRPARDNGAKKPRFTIDVLSYNICPTCEARLPANFRTCGRCGTKLQNFCPHCSAAVPSDVSFCGKCGKSIT